MGESGDAQGQNPTQIENKSRGVRLKKAVLLLPAKFKVPFAERLLQNKWTRSGVLAVAIVPLVAVLAWFGWSNSSLSKLSADIALTEGTVQYRVQYDYPWENVQEGMSFGEGAQLRTLGDSRAVLNIDDGSAVRLNSNSSVILTKLTSRHIIIDNTGGDVYTRVVKSDNRVFQVRSGSGTYQSLGTAYRTFNSDEKEGVEVYHSKVNILGIKADGNVLVEQGERYFAVNTAATDLEGKVTELSLAELSADEFLKWNSDQDRKHFENELGVLFDLMPPALEVTSPSNSTSTEAASIEVKGTAETDAKVLINGAEVVNDNGQFTAVIDLNEGVNGIKVEAVDSAGNKTVKDLSITRTTPATKPTTSFVLYGTKVDKGVSFTWNISGISVTEGFKIVRSTSANPTYSKKSESVYIEKSSDRSYTWKIQDGQTYNFRVCTYDGTNCTNYSNNVKVTAPTKPASEAPTGSLTLSHTGGNNVSWVLSGSAPQGFKLVWSTSTGPTYPGSSAQFYDKDDTTGSINDSSGTYYVRICMYQDGTCKNYSNEVTVVIP